MSPEQVLMVEGLLGSLDEPAKPAFHGTESYLK